MKGKKVHVNINKKKYHNTTTFMEHGIKEPFSLNYY